MAKEYAEIVEENVEMRRILSLFCQYMEEQDDYCCSQDEWEYCSKEKEHNNPYFMAQVVLKGEY